MRALLDEAGRLDADEVEARVRTAAGALGRRQGEVIAVLGDNGPGWLVAARAIEAVAGTLLPLPGFFTAAQCRHVLEAAGVELLLTDDRARAGLIGFDPGEALPGTGLLRAARTPHAPSPWQPSGPANLPAGTGIVTFTSGTTGQPRGVCLCPSGVAAASSAVADVARALGIKRHLCMLPLAVLLEQVAGAEAAWQADAECVLVPLAEVGVSGSSGFDARRALGAIERWQPQSLILLPQMLLALVEAVESAAAAGRGCAALRSLRLAAVGGGRVSPELIARARRLGIPACEGYGLTECASVVALAAPDDPPGSGMRMLGHARARIDRSGEILIEGPGFAGYLGQASRNGIDVPDAAAPVRTGDLGSLDAGGRLRVTGRIKHQLITGFGRNVSPEWPEAELAAQPAIRQVAVFGEGRPWLCAVIVPSAGADPASIAAAVARANDALPDYARIGGWIAAADGCNGFTPANGLATGNGRLRRDAILARHADRIDRLYLEHPAEVHDVVP